MEKTYTPNKCRTYREMILEAISFLRPDLDKATLHKLTKTEAQELYCHIKNNEYGKNTI